MLFFSKKLGRIKGRRRDPGSCKRGIRDGKQKAVRTMWAMIGWIDSRHPRNRRYKMRKPEELDAKGDKEARYIGGWEEDGCQI